MLVSVQNKLSRFYISVSVPYGAAKAELSQAACLAAFYKKARIRELLGFS
jgi:hypothetical protein